MDVELTLCFLQVLFKQGIYCFPDLSYLFYCVLSHMPYPHSHITFPTVFVRKSHVDTLLPPYHYTNLTVVRACVHPSVWKGHRKLFDPSKKKTLCISEL